VAATHHEDYPMIAVTVTAHCRDPVHRSQDPRIEGRARGPP
jgi:hypothetical protein